MPPCGISARGGYHRRNQRPQMGPRAYRAVS
jgi:hypothetical protein